MVRSKGSSRSLPVYDIESNRLGKRNQALLSFGRANEFWEYVLCTQNVSTNRFQTVHEHSGASSLKDSPGG